MTGIGAKAVCQLLTDAFRPNEFNAFCQHYFPDVSEQFSTGMGRSVRVHLLIDSCERTRDIDHLISLVTRINLKRHGSDGLASIQPVLPQPDADGPKGLVSLKPSDSVDFQLPSAQQLAHLLKGVELALACSLDLVEGQIKAVGLDEQGNILLLLPTEGIRRLHSISTPFIRAEFGVAKLVNTTYDLDSVDWTGHDLSETDLGQIYLVGARLQRAILSGANLGGAFLRQADLREADLRRASLWRADLSAADLRAADLTGAGIASANLSRARLRGTILNRVNLKQTFLKEADLRGAELVEANLREAKLMGAQLAAANMAGAVLERADLRGANLMGVNLRGARLNQVDLRGADLTLAELDDLNLSDVIYDAQTKWPAAAGLPGNILPGSLGDRSELGLDSASRLR